MSDWRDSLPPARGKVLKDAVLAPYTWLRVGGPAEVLFLPEDEDDLAGFLQGLEPTVPVTPIGVGSNLLVRDGGVEGVDRDALVEGLRRAGHRHVLPLAGPPTRSQV